ncbi:MAG: NAD(P)H-binding protein [Thermoleophilaceae bacterium]
MELVTGARGYVGGRLLERLVAERRPVRALVRNPGFSAPADVEVAQADVLAGRGLDAALDGVTTAYYLIHSMSASGGREFETRDRLAANNFARAAQRHGIERVVYLGGILPPGERLSPHLRSRLEVERILLDGAPASTALRASILIGARSSSFRILVRLIERLRLLPFPAWSANRTQPIDERDAIEYLARTPSTPAAAGRSLDIAGADMLSYRAMIERIAASMGVARTPLRLGLSQTPSASAVVARLVDQPLELVRPLMESLEYELLPRDESAQQIYGLRLRHFDRAVEHALREWERTGALAAR